MINTAFINPGHIMKCLLITKDRKVFIMEKSKTCAVILAAGTSSRMGRLKQLMPIGDKPLLQHVIEKVLINDFTDVYTVVGYESKKIMTETNIRDERHHWVVNNDYKSGQSTSVKMALGQMNGKYNHVMITLGDLPFIKDETIERVHRAGSELTVTQTSAFIVRPICRNKVGHPVFIGNINEHMIGNLEGDSGFKSIKTLFGFKQLIKTDDDGINFDIDTIEEYRIAKERFKNQDLVP